MAVTGQRSPGDGGSPLCYTKRLVYRSNDPLYRSNDPLYRSNDLRRAARASPRPRRRAPSTGAWAQGFLGNSLSIIIYHREVKLGSYALTAEQF